jgi:hypothetical protein
VGARNESELVLLNVRRENAKWSKNSECARPRHCHLVVSQRALLIGEGPPLLDPILKTDQSSPYLYFLDGADFSRAQLLEKFPVFLRSMKVHHSVRMVPPLFKIPSRFDVINTLLSSYLSNIHFNISSHL